MPPSYSPSPRTCPRKAHRRSGRVPNRIFDASDRAGLASPSAGERCLPRSGVLHRVNGRHRPGLKSLVTTSPPRSGPAGILGGNADDMEPRLVRDHGQPPGNNRQDAHDLIDQADHQAMRQASSVTREASAEGFRVKMKVYTVGHSTRAIEDFVALLKAFDIETLVDVRTIARSRHNPQYNEAELDASLGANGISYVRLTGLGGLRQTTSASVNKAWKNLSFRGYADYMQTPEFLESLGQLTSIAARQQTVIMCAEAVPWRCHRSLIGDALLIRGASVEDIFTDKSIRLHRLTAFAQVVGKTITYPAQMG